MDPYWSRHNLTTTLPISYTFFLKVFLYLVESLERKIKWIAKFQKTLGEFNM